MAEERINFEKSLNKLKEIVSAIQEKEIPLEESLKLYEEGSKIIKELNQELVLAEQKVEKIIEVNK